jgi:drug/metabolite transporter (DMT)-like permease
LWFAWGEAFGYGLLQWALIAASGAIHAVYTVSLLRGYRLADLSVVYPVARGSAPLMTSLAATAFMGESLGLQGWVGVLAVVLGIVLVTGGTALWHAFRAGAQAHEHLGRLRAGVVYGLLTGLCIAGYSVVDGYAVKHAAVSPVAIDFLADIVRVPVTALWVWALGRRQPLPMAGYWREHWKFALLIAVISPIAYVLVLYAMTMAPLSHVAPARELSMLFAALLGVPCCASATWACACWGPAAWRPA